MSRRIWLACGMTMLLIVALSSQIFAEKITLQVWDWGDIKSQERWNQYAEKYSAINPNVKIEAKVLDFGSYMQKLPVAIAGGTAPDIITTATETSNFVTVAKLGGFVDLKPFIEKDTEVSLDAWQPGAISSFTIDGKLYALPSGSNYPDMVWYNADLLDKAGLAYPTPKWTSDDFLTYATKLTKRDAGGKVTQWGLCMFDLTGVYRQWLWENGTSLFNSSITEFTGAGPKAKEVFEKINHILFKSGAVPDAGVFEAAGVPSYEFFSTGKLGMDVWGHWVAPRFARMNKFRWAGVSVPLFKAGVQHMPALDVQGFGISAKSAHKKEAYEFIKWYITQSLSDLLKGPYGSNVVPAFIPVANSLDWLKSPPGIATNMIINNDVKIGRPNPATVKEWKAIDVFNQYAGTTIFSKSVDNVGKLLDEAKVKIEKWLKEYKD